MNRLTKTALVLVFFAVLLTACRREPAVPLPDGLPDAEIVFMPEAGLVYVDNDSTTLGFIQADGSNRQEYTFIIRGCSGLMFAHYFTHHAFRPRWSQRGDTIIFAIRDSACNVRLIDTEGRMHGAECDLLDKGFPTTTDAAGNILGTLDAWHPQYEDYHARNPDMTLVIRADLIHCAIAGEVYLPLSENERIPTSFGENQDGLFVANYYDLDTDQDMILLFDPQTAERRSFPGIYPSFSDDGRWLAYYTADGNLIVRDLATDEEQVLVRGVFSYARTVSMPGWSPDSRWLVYNTEEGMIFKVNRETGERVYLTDGWAPDWR